MSWLSMKKRGGLFFIVALTALSLLFPVAAFVSTPDQIHVANPKFHLTFSAPITITSGILSEKGSLTALETYKEVDFVAVAGTGNKEYEIAVTLPGEGEFILTLEEKDFATGRPLGKEVVAFEYVAEGSSTNIHLKVNSGLRLLKRTSGGALDAGFAQQTPYDVVFETTSPAHSCKFTTDPGRDPSVDFTSTGTPENPTTTHTIARQTVSEMNISVGCDFGTAGAPQQIRKTFTVGYDDTAPLLNVTMMPPKIVDPTSVKTNMTIKEIHAIPQKIFCTATGDTTDATSGDLYLPQRKIDELVAYERRPNVLLFFAEQPTTEMTKYFSLTCMNRAGRTVTQQHNVTIALNTEPEIVMISPEGACTKQTSPTLTIQVHKSGVPVALTTCEVRSGGATLGRVDDYTWSAPLSGLEGEQRYLIYCLLQNAVEVTNTVEFIVDASPPPGPPARTITAPQYVCGDVPLTAHVTLNEDTPEDENFIGYNYTLTYASGPLILEHGESVSGDLEASTVPNVSKRYQWHVWPLDCANNKGVELTAVTEALAANDSRCDHTAPAIDIMTKAKGAVVLVWPNCTDDGVGCSATYKYNFQEDESEPCVYNSTEQYLNGSKLPRWLDIYEDALFCINVSDKNGNWYATSQLLKISDFVPHLLYTSPLRYATSRDVDVRVGAQVGDDPIKSTSCSCVSPSTEPFLGLLSSADSYALIWQKVVSVSKDADYTIVVNCTLQNGRSVKAPKVFTVDSKPPRGYAVDAKSDVCIDLGLFIGIKHDPTVESEPTIYLNYSITHADTSGTVTLDEGMTTSKALSYDPGRGVPNEKKLYVNETYQWQIEVLDAAGNHQSPDLTFTQKVVPSGDVACDRKAPEGTVKFLPEQGGVRALVDCTDVEGDCNDAFSFSILPRGKSLSACTFNQSGSLASQLTTDETLFFKPGSFCFVVFDMVGNNHTGIAQFTLNLTNAITNTTTNTTNGTVMPTWCTNGELDLLRGETGVDCGGPCSPCALNDHCGTDDDCAPNICLNNICSPDICTNGIKDESEADVDCGGSCGTPCSEGKQCSDGDDCATGYCNDLQLCEATSCSDGSQNGYESDVDCGGTCSSCADGLLCGENKDCLSQYCDSGTCVESTFTNTEGETQAAHPFLMIGLILLILGLLTMGGSGYWLSMLHEGHAEEPYAESPAYVSAQRQDLTPEQRTALLEQRRAQLAAAEQQQRAAAQQRSAAKAAERQQVMKAIVGDEKKPESAMPPVDEKTAEEDPSDDGFVDISEIGAKSNPSDKVESGKGEEPKKKSAFSDLDSIIDKKGG